MGMSTTLELSSPIDGSIRGSDALLLKAIPVGAFLLVLVQAVALFLGAPLGIAEVMAALGVTAIGAALIRRGTPVAPIAAAGWLAANAITLGLVGTHPQAFSLVAVLNIGLLGLAALSVGERWYLALVAFVVALQCAGLLSGAGTDATVPAMTCTLGLGIALMVRRLEWRQAGSERAIRTLTDERSTVARLYGVATSIGASTTRAEALPDLLGVVAEAVGARSAAVAVLDASRSSLTLSGPVWVNGSHIPVDDDVVAQLERNGFGSRALRTTRAIRFDRAGAVDISVILTDLGLDNGLVSPLRLEGIETGLLIVGDPIDGVFDEADIAELTALAAPVSLVLGQVGRHEAALELAVQLKEIADMKTDFVSMVSHELKTPLTSVIGALDTLARPDLSLENPAVQEMLHGARRQSARLHRLIDDLLVLSRIDRGLVTPDTRVVVLADVIADITEVLPRCELSIHAPSDLAVMGDPDHLSQILINLAENAVKYGGGSLVEIKAARCTPEEVAITVSDHGPGIPESQRERVFDRFVRLEGPMNAKVGGTGLGLSIVKMLAEGMGGRVGVVETPGGGATFVVSLPVAR
jgi:signal transduction histidine kinase